jgi:phosphoribosylanthranilate isomerase
MNKIPCLFRRTRVKICGFTRPEDAQTAVRLGADAVGLVFYPPSPRNVRIEQAREIVAALPPFVTVVGLFVDEPEAGVRQVLEQVRIDLLQFHGDEAPEYCGRFLKPYIKAVRMQPGLDLMGTIGAYRDASGFLLDAWHPDAKGGTGSRFDWRLIPEDLAGSLILAGGLSPGNVAEALGVARPYALDVSSGVEAAKGIKDAGKMAAFIQAVHQFDHRHYADSSL